MEADDLWVKNLTPSLKPKYPDFPKRNSPGERDGGWDPKARISEMEVDGVSAEVLYPTLRAAVVRVRGRRTSGSLLPDRQRLDDRLLQSDTGALDRHPDDLALQYQQCHQGTRSAARRRGLIGSLIWQVPPAHLPFTSDYYDPFGKPRPN